MPVESPSRDVDSAVELLEHVGATQLLATVHQPSVTQGDSTGRSNGEGGKRAVVSSAPDIGGFRGRRRRRELPPWLMYAQLREGRQGRDLDRENSLAPCRPPWLGPCDFL